MVYLLTSTTSSYLYFNLRQKKIYNTLSISLTLISVTIKLLFRFLFIYIYIYIYTLLLVINFDFNIFKLFYHYYCINGQFTWLLVFLFYNFQ